MLTYCLKHALLPALASIFYWNISRRWSGIRDEQTISGLLDCAADDPLLMVEDLNFLDVDDFVIAYGRPLPMAMVCFFWLRCRKQIYQSGITTSFSRKMHHVICLPRLSHRLFWQKVLL